MIYSCKDCTKRHIACHATCSDYIQDKKEWDELKARMAKDREGWCMAVEQQQKSVQKALKRKR